MIRNHGIYYEGLDKKCMHLWVSCSYPSGYLENCFNTDRNLSHVMKSKILSDFDIKTHHYLVVVNEEKTSQLIGGKMKT